MWSFCSSVGKESACNAEDPGSISGSGRSPGEGNGNPLWYSCLGNPMDTGAWQSTVHGVAKSRTWLSDRTTTPWWSNFSVLDNYNVDYSHLFQSCLLGEKAGTGGSIWRESGTKGRLLSHLQWEILRCVWVPVWINQCLEGLIEGAEVGRGSVACKEPSLRLI